MTCVIRFASGSRPFWSLPSSMRQYLSHDMHRQVRTSDCPHHRRGAPFTLQYTLRVNFKRGAHSGLPAKIFIDLRNLQTPPTSQEPRL